MIHTGCLILWIFIERHLTVIHLSRHWTYHSHLIWYTGGPISIYCLHCQITFGQILYSCTRKTQSFFAEFIIYNKNRLWQINFFTHKLSLTISHTYTHTSVPFTQVAQTSCSRRPRVFKVCMFGLGQPLWIFRK